MSERMTDESVQEIKARWQAQVLPAPSQSKRDVRALLVEVERLRDLEAKFPELICGFSQAITNVTLHWNAALDESWTQLRTGERLEVENAALRKALADLLEHYVDGANSGDWGFWNPEDEDQVKQARALLTEPEDTRHQ